MIEHWIREIETFQFGTAVQAVGHLVGFENLAFIQKSAGSGPGGKDIGSEQDAVAVFDVKFPGLAHRIIGRLSHVMREGHINKHIGTLLQYACQFFQPGIVFQHE